MADPTFHAFQDISDCPIEQTMFWTKRHAKLDLYCATLQKRRTVTHSNSLCGPRANSRHSIPFNSACFVEKHGLKILKSGATRLVLVIRIIKRTQSTNTVPLLSFIQKSEIKELRGWRNSYKVIDGHKLVMWNLSNRGKYGHTSRIRPESKWSSYGP